MVRQQAGYLRHDTEEELILLNQLYPMLRLYTNFFQSMTKLISKERVKSKVKKPYNEPKTPFMRVVDSTSIDNSIKKSLQDQYEELNPTSAWKLRESHH